MDRTQITATVATLAAAGGIDALAHLGPTGLVIGGIAAYVVYRHAPDVLTNVEMVPALPEKIVPTRQVTGGSSRSFTDRLLGRFPDEEQEYPVEDEEPEYDDEDELEAYRPRSERRNFSDMLHSFTPSLERIYLATLPDGTHVYSDARGLCHVALAGVTGNGKSSLVRLLMCQLCKAGAQVLLLNPHYTDYDLEQDEDWTPFKPYLVHDPMECSRYEVIEHYLRQAATVTLPKRLERYRRSQPTGKPYFIVIDELPAIVKRIKETPGYLADILQEGRKVGMYLISGSQNFLVQTIAPKGGGAVRECYRTAFYVGGDAKTANVLLDIPARDIQENTLGKGTVMLRSKTVKQAHLAHVPYVDNEALYKLLGPSTYQAQASYDDNLELSTWGERPEPERPYNPFQHTEAMYRNVMPSIPMREVPAPQPEAQPATAERPMTEIERAVQAWNNGATSVRKLMLALNVTYYQANQLYQKMKTRHLID